MMRQWLNTKIFLCEEDDVHEHVFQGQKDFMIA